MNEYEIQFTKSSRRELTKLPKKVVAKVVTAIRNLAEDPRPKGCKKLKGEGDTWRIRVGNYRVVYQVHDKDVF